MNGMVVREIVREDVPAVIALLADDRLGARRERFEEPLPECYWRAFEAMARSDAVRILVAEQQGRIVGCLQLNMIPGLARQGEIRAQLEAVRVASDRRGAGIGGTMVRHAMALARERGCGLVELTTDKTRKDAHRFWQRMGFEATHEGMKILWR